MEPLSVKSLQEAIKSAVLELESNFTKKLKQYLSPVKVQLIEIQASLSKTVQVAETAFEVGVALQEET